MKKFLMVLGVLLVGVLIDIMSCMAATKKPLLVSSKGAPLIDVLDSDSGELSDDELDDLPQRFAVSTQNNDSKKAASKEPLKVALPSVMTVQPSVAAHKLPTIFEQTVSKEALDLGLWAYVCDSNLLEETLKIVKDGNVIVDEKQQRTALHKIAERVATLQDFSEIKDARARNEAYDRFIKEQRACIALLIKYGAKVDQQDVFGNTPLHIASSQGNCMCVRWLLEQKAPVNSRRLGKGWTPLFMAIMYSRFPSSAVESNAFITTIQYLIVCGGADCGLVGGVEKAALFSDTRRPCEVSGFADVINTACRMREQVVKQLKDAAEKHT